MVESIDVVASAQLKTTLGGLWELQDTEAFRLTSPQIPAVS